MSNKSKSLKMIYEQSMNILQEIALKGWNGKEYSEESLKRMDFVASICKRYVNNIQKHFRGCPYVTNEEYIAPVSKSIYMNNN